MQHVVESAIERWDAEHAKEVERGGPQSPRAIELAALKTLATWYLETHPAVAVAPVAVDGAAVDGEVGG